MTGNLGIHVLTDAQWAALEPLIDEARPHCKVPHGVALGMTFPDGTSIRAHQKAAGAEKRGPTARSATAVRRSAARAAATAPRHA